MRPRFIADADLNHRIVVGLRRREPCLDFLGARDGGVIGLPDPEVIDIASGANRILVSHDFKTMPGHFAMYISERSSSGVLLISQDVSIGNAIEELVLFWLRTDASDWVDRLGYLPL